MTVLPPIMAARIRNVNVWSPMQAILETTLIAIGLVVRVKAQNRRGNGWADGVPGLLLAPLPLETSAASSSVGRSLLLMVRSTLIVWEQLYTAAGIKLELH